jgi:hypothetical protein
VGLDDSFGKAAESVAITFQSSGQGIEIRVHDFSIILPE